MLIIMCTNWKAKTHVLEHISLSKPTVKSWWLMWEWHKSVLPKVYNSDIWCYDSTLLLSEWQGPLKVEWRKQKWCNLAEPKANIWLHIPSNRTCSFPFWSALICSLPFMFSSLHLNVTCGKQDDLKITHHADNSLNSFCKWQKKLNMKGDEHPLHHDVSVLLTR